MSNRPVSPDTPALVRQARVNVKFVVPIFRARRLTELYGMCLALVLMFIPMRCLGSDEDAKDLLSALASDSCESRTQAISRYSRSEDNETDRNAALRRLSGQADPRISQEVSSVLTLMADERVGQAKILALTERIAGFKKLSKDARDRSLGEVRQDLLRIIHDPRERMAARMAAPWLLVRVVLAGSADHPEWKTEWGQALARMLRSSDRSLRVVGAATAALYRFPEGTDPITADIVRPLIDGLRDDSVNVRAAAYLGLEDLGADTICFNATATQDRRTLAIRQWEAWWDANRGRLERERVVQQLW